MTQKASIFLLTALSITSAAQATELLNGGSSSEAISSPGEVDTHTFEASAGDAIVISIADVRDDPTFFTGADVYDPNDALVGRTIGGTINFRAEQSGTYEVVVQDAQPFTDPTGDYVIYFVRAPGAREGGQLVNGGVISDSIDAADLDSYVFDALEGEGIHISVGDFSDDPVFSTLTSVYDPSGEFLERSVGGVVTLQAPVSGTYTVVVQDTQPFTTPSGNYEIHFVRAPGAAEGGQLPNGGAIEEVIEKGDLDSYVFDALEGEGIHISIGDLGEDPVFSTLVTLYDPNGRELASSTSGVITGVSPADGTYTVVVQDSQPFAMPEGPYVIYFARAPGAAEGGELGLNSAISGFIDLGDLDSYIFLAQAGEDRVLTVSDDADPLFGPRLSVYDPVGAQVASTTSGQLTLSNLAGGTYTVIVQDQPTFSARTGGYTLRLSSTALPPLDPPASNGVECPPLDPDVIKEDSVVVTGMKEAWTRATSGPIVMEHGFNIYQCRTRIVENGQPTFRYRTELDLNVEPAPQSTRHLDERMDPGCRLVGIFHTHPEDGTNRVLAAVINLVNRLSYIQRGQVFERTPSDADAKNAKYYRVPGILMYQEGRNGEGGELKTTVFNREASYNLNWECSQ